MSTRHLVAHLEAVLIVAIGGFAGANLRFFIDLQIPSTLGATLTVNVLGCLALGFFLYEELFADVVSASSRTVLATGFLASFTTYSTFVVDALAATPQVGIAYVVASYAFGFVAVLGGRESARIATRSIESGEG